MSVSSNPYNYCVAVFDGDKFVVDTAEVGNRLFGLRGQMGECLELASRMKTEIHESPLCALRVIHDPGGGWKERVRAWLDGA